MPSTSQTKQTPVQDFAAELYACTTLMDLCLFRDKLHTLIVESQKAGATYGTAAYYLAQAKAQIYHLTAKGFFLAPVSTDDFKKRLNEIEARTNNLASGIAEANKVMHNALRHIGESEDIEAATSIAKNTLRMFAPSPTDHTNQ